MNLYQLAFFADAFGFITQLPNNHGQLNIVMDLLRLAEVVQMYEDCSC